MDLLILGRGGGAGLGEELRYHPLGRPARCQLPGFQGQSRDQRSHTRPVLRPMEMFPEVRTMLGRRTEKDLHNMKESEVIVSSFTEGEEDGS